MSMTIRFLSTGDEHDCQDVDHANAIVSNEMGIDGWRWSADERFVERLDGERVAEVLG